MREIGGLVVSNKNDSKIVVSHNREILVIKKINHVADTSKKVRRIDLTSKININTSAYSSYIKKHITKVRGKLYGERFIKTGYARSNRGSSVVYSRPGRRSNRPLMFSKDSIMLDIQHQNFAGKPCLQASEKALMRGRLEFKAHGFHQ
jgi:hypothetical protein